MIPLERAIRFDHHWSSSGDNPKNELLNGSTAVSSAFLGTLKMTNIGGNM
jgi:hypothetical protein